MKKLVLMFLFSLASLNSFAFEDEALQELSETDDLVLYLEPLEAKKIKADCHGINGQNVTRTFEVDVDNPFPGMRAIAKWAKKNCDGDVHLSASLY